MKKDQERKNVLNSKEGIRKEMPKEWEKEGKSREHDMESGQEGMNRRNNPASKEEMREDQQREGMDIE